MEELIPLVLAPAVSLITKALEQRPQVPYGGQTKAGIVAALLGVSIAARFGLAAYTGQLQTLDLGEDVKLFGEALTSALVAAGGYALAKSDKPVV